MLGDIVTFVSVDRLPVVPKLKLLDLVAYPMEPHVHGLNATGSIGIVYDADLRGVVTIHWHGGLRVAHCVEGVSGGNYSSTIDVEIPKLRIGGGGHDVLNYLGNCHNGPIIWGIC